MTRAAALLSDALDDWIDREGTDLFALPPRAVWLKALLLHAASCPGFVEFARPVVQGDDTRKKLDDQRRLLDALVGFGIADIDRVLGGASHRVTVMGGGVLLQDEAHTYEFPLPKSLLRIGRLFQRSLRITLAWLSPPWPTTAAYRGAALSLDTVDPPRGLTLGKPETDHRAVGRGTAIHKVWMPHRGRAAFLDGDAVSVKVTCRADALPQLDEPIPYALVVTLEVEAGLPVDIWQDVRAKVAPRIRPRVR